MRYTGIRTTSGHEFFVSEQPEEILSMISSTISMGLDLLKLTKLRWETVRGEQQYMSKPIWVRVGSIETISGGYHEWTIVK